MNNTTSVLNNSINNSAKVLSTDTLNIPKLSDSVLGHTRELDPLGLNQHAPGAKLDVGKNRVGLVLSGFPRALTHVSKVGTYGANKYLPKGFLAVEDGEARYTDAMMRHWLKECMGEEYDLVDEKGNPGTEELHAACVAWNALARLEFILMAKEKAAHAEHLQETFHKV